MSNCAKGHRLYGLTNWATDTFALVRHRYPIFDLLDGSGEEKVTKPDPRIFRILLERYNIDPAPALFVDDNMPNITAARAFGMQAILFRSASQLREFLVPIC